MHDFRIGDTCNQMHIIKEEDKAEDTKNLERSTNTTSTDCDDDESYKNTCTSFNKNYSVGDTAYDSMDSQPRVIEEEKEVLDNNNFDNDLKLIVMPLTKVEQRMEENEEEENNTH